MEFVLTLNTHTPFNREMLMQKMNSLKMSDVVISDNTEETRKANSNDTLCSFSFHFAGKYAGEYFSMLTKRIEGAAKHYTFTSEFTENYMHIITFSELHVTDNDSWLTWTQNNIELETKKSKAMMLDYLKDLTSHPEKFETLYKSAYEQWLNCQDDEMIDEQREEYYCQACAFVPRKLSHTLRPLCANDCGRQADSGDTLCFDCAHKLNACRGCGGRMDYVVRYGSEKDFE